MATIGDLITEALQELGVVEAGGTPTGNDSALGLRKINDLIDQWAGERLMMFTVTRTTWSITASDATYTVGSGGNINIPWPTYIQHVQFIDTSMDEPQEFPMNPLTDDAWAAVAMKGLTSEYPTCWYFDSAYSSGLGTLNLWPVPTSSTLTGVIYAATQVSEFSALTTPVALPPGYRRMIVKSLVCELAPAFGRSGAVQLTQEHAKDAKTSVQRQNVRLFDMSIDRGALGVPSSGRYFWSIWSGA